MITRRFGRLSFIIAGSVLLAAPLGAQGLDAGSATFSQLLAGAGLATDEPRVLPKVPACAPRYIACGQTLETAITYQSCRTADGYYGNIHLFQGAAGQMVTIDMMATAFDPVLGLADPTFHLVAGNDDGGPGGDARIVHYLGQAAGQWAIVSTSFFPYSTGPYTLRLLCSDGPAPPPLPPPSPIDTGDTSPCVADGFTLCAANGRFEVTATSLRSLFPNLAGRVSPVMDGELGGAFHFFKAEQNFHVVVKLARRPGGYFSASAVALEGLPWTVRIRDTLTGQVKVYENLAGGLGAPTDAQAFPADP